MGMVGGCNGLIALWFHDELSFNKNHSNYDSIVQIMRHDTRAGETNTTGAVTLVKKNLGPTGTDYHDGARAKGERFQLEDKK